MKTESLKFFKIFSGGGDVHYILPHFQREYTWEKAQWDTLLKDSFSIYEEFSENYVPEHFMGSIVVINDGTRAGTMPAFKLVDGQQRVTTISLILCSLANIVKESDSKLSGKIMKLLLNDEDSPDLKFKLLPTSKNNDREVYKNLLLGKTIENEQESNILKSYNYINTELKKKIELEEISSETFFNVICNCFQFIFIELDKDESPYKIFESLNAKGKKLTQADLVRNYIAMRLPSNTQELVFENKWMKIENVLKETRTVGKSRLGELTAFLRHYLAMETGILCNEEHVYARFRDRAETHFKNQNLFIEEIEKIRIFSEYYNKLIRPDSEQRENIKEQLKRLSMLDISTAFPFFMTLFHLNKSEKINEQQLLSVFKIIEGFLIRRYICGEPSNYLNKMFPSIIKDFLEAENYAETIKRILMSRKCPSDNKVKSSLLETDIYDNRQESKQKLVLILDSINKFLSRGTGGYTVLDSKPTIEHIMPQNKNPAWNTEIGENYEEVHSELLNVIGNLTIVTQEWNSSMSDSNFQRKKELLSKNALKINNGYFTDSNLLTWNEESIKNRTIFLADIILKLWDELSTVESQNTKIFPRKLVINETEFIPETWRDVAIYTVEYFINDTNFKQNAKKFSSYLSEGVFLKSLDRGATRQLSNGYYINLHYSGESIKRFCKRFISEFGLSESKWVLEEKEANA